MERVAVVTGADSELTFGIVMGMLARFDGDVYLTSRDEGKGKAAVAKLNEFGLTPEYHQLDVTDRDSVLRFRDHVKEEYNRSIDILVINTAGIKSVELDNSTQELVLPLIVETILIATGHCGQLGASTKSEQPSSVGFCFARVCCFAPRSRDNRSVHTERTASRGSVAVRPHLLTNVRLTMDDSQVEDINDFMSLFMEGFAEGNCTNDVKDDEGTRPVDIPTNITMKINFNTFSIKIAYED